MVERERIRQALVALVEAETEQPMETLDDAALLQEELGLDSLARAGVVMQIEERFQIRLTHQELKNVARVGDLLDLIQAKMGPDSRAAA
jgi:acyl carrier protein